LLALTTASAPSATLWGARITVPLPLTAPSPSTPAGHQPERPMTPKPDPCAAPAGPSPTAPPPGVGWWPLGRVWAAVARRPARPFERVPVADPAHRKGSDKKAVLPPELSVDVDIDHSNHNNVPSTKDGTGGGKNSPGGRSPVVSLRSVVVSTGDLSLSAGGGPPGPGSRPLVQPVVRPAATVELTLLCRLVTLQGCLELLDPARGPVPTRTTATPPFVSARNSSKGDNNNNSSGSSSCGRRWSQAGDLLQYRGSLLHTMCARGTAPLVTHLVAALAGTTDVTPPGAVDMHPLLLPCCVPRSGSHPLRLLVPCPAVLLLYKPPSPTAPNLRLAGLRHGPAGPTGLKSVVRRALSLRDSDDRRPLDAALVAGNFPAARTLLQVLLCPNWRGVSLSQRPDDVLLPLCCLVSACRALLFRPRSNHHHRC